ncbi:hypothetical protein [Streptomyces sp. NPDC023838]|uniref:hypothetical protein n=1 Tax=Streptomyces sp. NPDC023838 TaxID=3154325 RepID=UPI0033D6314E
MRTALLRNGARAAAAALALATAFGGVATAAAPGHGDRGEHGRQAVPIEIGAFGIHAPDKAAAGLVAFHVRTNDAKGRFVQAFRPHKGVTVKKVIADLTKAVSRTPAGAQGISAARDDAEWFGGAQVTPAVSETFTTRITPGQVVLIDFGAFLEDQKHPVLRTLTLHGAYSGHEAKSDDLADFPDGIVITRETPGGPRFDVHGVRKAKDSILVHNASDELHEMQVQPVKPHTRDAEIQSFFNGPMNGPPPFVTGPALGLGLISPGRTTLLENHGMPAGTYALLCFVPDDKTGRPHVAEGMHKVLRLT